MCLRLGGLEERVGGVGVGGGGELRRARLGGRAAVGGGGGGIELGIVVEGTEEVGEVGGSDRLVGGLSCEREGGERV